MKLFIFYIVAAISVSNAASFNIGKTKLLPEGRIRKGQNATEGQFPYMVGIALQNDIKSTLVGKCGGSLIDHEWILTAAHCLIGVKQVTVFLGVTNIWHPEARYAVLPKDFIVHPNYDSVSMENDIGLIKIPYTSYTTKIMPVRLPSATSGTYSGYTAQMSGWGRTTEDITAVDDLQWTELRVSKNSVCAKRVNQYIADSFLCARSNVNSSLCKGDSGGPLVLEFTNTQIGIGSFSFTEHCVEDVRAAFTRVTSFSEWIKQHTGISY